MGLFPRDAIDGDEVTNANGTTFRYVAIDDKWIIVSIATVSDAEYNATSWDANIDVATKNAIRDKIVSMDSLITANTTPSEAVAAVLADDKYVKNYESDVMNGDLTVNNLITAGLVDNVDISARDHARSHAVTSASDHTANNWKILYTNGSGNVIELAIGADTKVLKSNGVTAAPSWEDDNTGGAGGDTDAIHDNVADEITAIAEKTTPVANDEIIIEDSAASYVKKSVKIGNLPSEVPYITYLKAGCSVAQINDAITTLSASGGGIVQLPAGTINIGTTSISMKAKVWLKGCGWDATKIQYTGTSQVILFSNVVQSEISDMTVWNDVRGFGVYLTGTNSQIRIHDCNIVSDVFTEDAICLVYNMDNTFIYIYNNHTYNYIMGIRAYSGSYVFIWNNIIRNCTQMFQMKYTGRTHFMFCGNHCWRKGNATAYGIICESTQYMIFNNNFIYGNSSSNYSVYLSCSYSIVDGNIITGSASELYYTGTGNVTGSNNLI